MSPKKQSSVAPPLKGIHGHPDFQHLWTCAMALVEGQRVNVVGGKYARKVGTVKALTPKMVKLDLDGQEVTILQNNVEPMPRGNPNSAPKNPEPKSKVVPERSAVGYQAEPNVKMPEETRKANEGDRRLVWWRNRISARQRSSWMVMMRNPSKWIIITLVSAVAPRA
eukprot:s776_g14.t1